MKSDDIESRTREALIDRIVRRAQAALIWESAWPWLATALGVVAAFLTVSWFGLWDASPPLGRMAGVALFALAFAAALAPLFRSAAPGREAALSRIDRASGVAHRPATSLDDTLAPTGDDAFTRALWRAHRERVAQEADRLRAGPPAPRLAARDPYALRFALGLVAVVAFAFAGSDRLDRVLAAFDWRTPAAETVPARLDAWVAPPGYTGRAPIFLTARAGATADHSAAATPENAPDTVRAPVNSTIVVRASGGTVDVAATGATQVIDAPKPPDGVTERRFKLTGDAELRVAGAGVDRVWRFSAIPDEPPSIKLSGPPQQNARGTATIAYEVKDDYGVAAADARFVLKPDGEPKPKTDAGKGGESDPPAQPVKRPLYEAPKVNLSLPRAKARDGKAETALDVMEHPWAGAEVTMTLRARDEAGQEGASAPTDMRLPARAFTKPLARALVEQRRALALDANAKPKVLAALNALMLYPEEFTPEAGIYLGLTTAASRLKIADTDDELRGVVDYLWQIAVRIEDGELGEAEKDLRAAEQALQKALENGASEKEIQKLTQDLRQALEKFMKEMAEQNRQNQGQQAQRNQRGDAKTVRPQDLRNMIDKMEQLSKQGAKDAARQALNDLRNMLDNLQNAQRQQADPNAQAQQQRLDKLQDMIREQGKLRDKTFQQYRQAEQTQRNQRGQQGARKPDKDGQDEMRDLAQQQQRLRDKLDQLRKEMRRDGGEPQETEKGEKGGKQPGDNPDLKEGRQRKPGGDQNSGAQQDGQSQDEAPGQQGQKDALGSAGESMGKAQGSLGEGQTGEALDSQQKALESLRKGAQAMAEQMQGKGKPGQNGKDGEQGAQNGENGRDDDPLGRPTRRTESDGTTTKVPGEIDAQRARKVLDELRKRLGDNDRSREELDYIERLLTP